MIVQNNQWSGQPAIIIGGGPSLKSFDWSALHGRSNIVVINRAFRDCLWADVFFTEDLDAIRLFSEMPEWKAFKGEKIFHAMQRGYGIAALMVDSSLYVIHKQREDKYWSRKLSDGLSQSSNSGVGAFNLVDILGANPIFLLGFDCNQLGRGVNVNYHQDYPENMRSGDHQMISFKNDFEWWVAPNMKHREIVNLNPDSALECWPKKHWGEVLK